MFNNRVHPLLRYSSDENPRTTSLEYLPNDLIRYIFMFAFSDFAKQMKDFCFSSKKIYEIMRKILAAQVERFRMNPAIRLTFGDAVCSQNCLAIDLIHHIQFSYSDQDCISCFQYFLESTLLPSKADPRFYQISLAVLHKIVREPRYYEWISGNSGIDVEKIIIAIYAEMAAFKYRDIKVLQMCQLFLPINYTIFNTLFVDLPYLLRRHEIPESPDEREWLVERLVANNEELLKKSFRFASFTVAITLLIAFISGNFMEKYELCLWMLFPFFCFHRVIIDLFTAEPAFSNKYSQIILKIFLSF